jgi:hypothetical protein
MISKSIRKENEIYEEKSKSGHTEIKITLHIID